MTSFFAFLQSVKKNNSQFILFKLEFSFFVSAKNDPHFNGHKSLPHKNRITFSQTFITIQIEPYFTFVFKRKESPRKKIGNA